MFTFIASLALVVALLLAEMPIAFAFGIGALVFAFDGQYFAQIRRYYDERRENERPCHHRQLELLVDDDVTF